MRKSVRHIIIRELCWALVGAAIAIVAGFGFWDTSFEGSTGALIISMCGAAICGVACSRIQEQLEKL